MRGARHLVRLWLLPAPQRAENVDLGIVRHVCCCVRVVSVEHRHNVPRPDNVPLEKPKELKVLQRLAYASIPREDRAVAAVPAPRVLSNFAQSLLVPEGSQLVNNAARPHTCHILC